MASLSLSADTMFGQRACLDEGIGFSVAASRNEWRLEVLGQFGSHTRPSIIYDAKRV